MIFYAAMITVASYDRQTRVQERGVLLWGSVAFLIDSWAI